MLMHHRPPAVMPRGEQDAAMAAFVLDILQGADQVRDATEAEAEADHGGPGTLKGVCVSVFGSSFASLFRTRKSRRVNGHGKGRRGIGGETYLVVLPL